MKHLDKKQKIFLFAVIPSILIIAGCFLNYVLGDHQELQTTNSTAISTKIPTADNKIIGSRKEAIEGPPSIKTNRLLNNYNIKKNESIPESKEIEVTIKETPKPSMQRPDKTQRINPRKNVQEDKQVVKSNHSLQFNSYTTGTNNVTTQKKDVLAYIHGDQTIAPGDLIKIRISQAIGEIPANSFLYGKCSLKGDRLYINISEANINNKLITCNLKMYGLDGNQGLHIPQSLGQENKKRSTGRAIQQIGNTLSRRLINGAGIVGDIAETTSEEIINAAVDNAASQARSVRIYLPNNEKIYLK